jgi:hypothetical protein
MCKKLKESVLEYVDVISRHSPIYTTVENYNLQFCLLQLMTQHRNATQTGRRQTTTTGVAGGLSGSIKKYESYLEDILGRHTPPQNYRRRPFWE